MHAQCVAHPGAPARGAVPRATVATPAGAPHQQQAPPRLHHQQGGAPHPPNLRGLHAAARLSNLFPRDAERVADADATWQAAAAPRRAAVAPPAESAAPGPKEARREAEEVLRRRHDAQRRARVPHEQAQRGPVPQPPPADRPRPTAGVGARAPGADFQAVKERKEAVRQRSFDDGDPDDCWGSSGGACGCSSGAAEDPFSFNFGAQSSGDGSSSNHSGSGAYNMGEEAAGAFESPSGAAGAPPVGADDDDAFYRSAEWDEFKRNWHRHSRAHHHKWYYTPSGGDSDGGAAPVPGAPGAAVCPASAEAAARRAVEAAARPAAGAAEEEARRREVLAAVAAAAAHAGHELTAFAAALQIEVDHSRGPEQARRSAKKGLLMAYHPDKLAGAAAGQRWLGNCVTQVLNSVAAA